MTAPTTPPPDPDPCGCGDEECAGFDKGGWLPPGGYVIPASTMYPVAWLSPEQVAAYNRVISRMIGEQYRTES